MKTRYIAGGAVATVLALVVMAVVATAWPRPEVVAQPAACVGGYLTGPITVTLTNLEDQNPGSPGHPKIQSVFPNLTYTDFTPDVLQNTGSESAVATIDVPADFTKLEAKTVRIGWKISWYGTDGADSNEGVVEVVVEQCRPPETTTTTTTEPTTTTSTSTTSTSTSTTSTSTSTTSTTQPTTTTTHPSTTTSTTQPTTTTSTSTTQPSTTSTSTTVPSTTSTTQPSTTSTTATTTTTDSVCELVDRVDSSSAICVIEAPPAAPVPASPVFTG